MHLSKISLPLKQPPLRVGIWLEAHPGPGFSHEGLVRLLSLIMNNSDPAAVQYYLTAPHWMRQTLETYVAQELQQTNGKKVFVLTPRRPRSWVTQHLALKPPQRKDPLSPASSSRMVRKKRTTPPALQLYNLVFNRRRMIYTLALLVLLSPLLTAIVVIEALVFALRASYPKLKSRIPRTPFVNTLLRLWRARPNVRAARPRLIQSVKDRLRQSAHARVFAEQTLATEFYALVKYVNRRDLVDCWFTINPTSKYAALLKQPLVTLFADFVFFDYPTGFDQRLIAHCYKSCELTLNRAARVICVSNFVRDRHLSRFDVPKSKSVVIQHACWDGYYAYEQYRTKTPQSRKCAADIIRTYLRSDEARQPWSETMRKLLDPYLRDFPFEDVGYILVSTQNRPYKNVMMLCRAFQIALRQRYADLKIVNTFSFDIMGGDDVSRFVREQSLHWDILSIPRVPPDVHAALYHAAKFTVHPSLFEGGANVAAFYEGNSVDTPCLAADSFAMREARETGLIDPDYYAEMTFDPYSINDLVAKLIDFDARTDYHTERQRTSFNTMRKRRTWQDASKDYLRVFQDAATEGALPAKGLAAV